LQTQLVWRIAAAMAVRQIGLIEDYDELVAVLRRRLSEVGSPCEVVGAVGGLADGHLTKIIAPTRLKVLGRISFTTLLRVLGIQLIAVVDDAVHEPIRRRLKPARFHRWPAEAALSGREMAIRAEEIGGMAEVTKVAGLREVVVVPVEEKYTTTVVKPERPRFDPSTPHLRYGPRRARNGAT
jgi:hypothetical protein